jgi:hypothetical protein
VDSNHQYGSPYHAITIRLEAVPYRVGATRAQVPDRTRPRQPPGSPELICSGITRVCTMALKATKNNRRMTTLRFSAVGVGNPALGFALAGSSGLSGGTARYPDANRAAKPNANADSIISMAKSRQLPLPSWGVRSELVYAVAVRANMRSILVAMMKSFSCSPLILLVCRETLALPQRKLIFG